MIRRQTITRRERLIAALLSEDDDLVERNGRIEIYGRTLDGSKIYLGCVSKNAMYQKGTNPRALIERIRFGAWE